MNYELFNAFKQKLADILQEQQTVFNSTSIDYASGNNITPNEQFQSLNSRLQSEDFRVLVIGKFNSGKSTFINALLGRSVLPTASVPKTAVIGEISYGEQEQATLVPKKGKYPKGDQPFSISLKDLDKYTSIKHSEDGSIETPFAKVLIRCPLSICKHGITLVDSPGTDDPDGNDAITNGYLPNADTVIYCMSSTAAYSKYDQTFISSLRENGHKSIVFVLTYFDTLEDRDELMGSHDADELKQHMYKRLTGMTDLEKKGIFFVSSLRAIVGKQKNKPEQLEASGFPDLEKRLENILVNQKGRIKITRVFYEIKELNRNLTRQIRDRIAVEEKDYTKCHEQLNNAEIGLTQAKKRLELIERHINSGIVAITSEVELQAMLFFQNELLPELGPWLDEFKPENKISLAPNRLKESIKLVAQECLEYLKMKISGKICSWSENKLMKEIVSKRFQDLLVGQTDNMRSYLESIKNVRLNLSLPEINDASGDDALTSTWARILSLGYYLVSGDIFGTFMGGLLGAGALYSALISQLVACGLLLVASLLTPIGLPVIIGTLATASIVGGGYEYTQITKRIKNKIKDEMQKKLEEYQPEFKRAVGQAVVNNLNVTMTKISGELKAPIQSLHNLVNQANSNMRTNGKARQEVIAELKESLRRNEDLTDKLDSYGKKLQLGLAHH